MSPVIVSSIGFCALFASLQPVQDQSQLFSALRVSEYFGEVYTALPSARASFVFFVGEPLAVVATIGNRGSSDESIHMERLIPLHVQLRKDGGLVAARLQFANPMLESPTRGTMPLHMADDVMTLREFEVVSWSGAIQDQLLPGQYQLTVTVDARDVGGRNVLADVPDVRFEIRERSAIHAAEISRREVLRHLAQENLEGAAAAAARLLRLHPRGFESYRLLGLIAAARGWSVDAQKYFDEAIRILTLNQDELLRKPKTSNEIEAIKADMAAAIKPRQ